MRAMVGVVFLGWRILEGLALGASPAVTGFRVESGETRYLSGAHTYSNMVVNGVLILTGDTVVTLVGPPLVESGVSDGMVFFIRNTGRIGNEAHPGDAGRVGTSEPFSAGPGGTSGHDSDPAVPEDPPGNGTAGQRGYDGGAGTAAGDGWSAPSLRILAEGGGVQLGGRIELIGSNGGRGGGGGKATDGGGGGHGGYSKFLVDGTGGAGGPGGNGGGGGRGGNAGNGGNLVIVTRGRVLLYADINVSAGNGGWGGDAGAAGAGGVGGSGGYRAVFGGGPGDGIPGRGGDAGRSGQPGSGGDGGVGGLIDIFARGDILHTGKPRRLASQGGRGGDRGSRGGGGAAGAAGGQLPDGSRGPYGAGTNEPDVGGSVGRAGGGGTIRLVSRGSIRATVDGQGYQLQAYAPGGEGGRPGDMDFASKSFNHWPEAQAGRLPGGAGGPGGSVQVKAKGSARVQASLRGGNGNYGAAGQGIAGVASAPGARGGAGGAGGVFDVVAPVIPIDPVADLVLTGGDGGPGGYPGNAGPSGPSGEAGPPGRAGALGRHRLVLADPALFPRTSRLEVTSKPPDKAPVGKVVRLRYTFTNDDPESPLENLRLVATWDSPYAEPVACDLDGSRNGRGFVAFPPDLPPGATLAWELSVRVLPPFVAGLALPSAVRITGELVGSPGDDEATLSLPLAPREDLWFDIVPDRNCGLPGGELGYEVRWANTSAEDGLTQVRIALAGLPLGVHQVAGASVWNLGPVGPGASGVERFTVWTASPWNEAWGRHFAIDGSASAAELEGSVALDSIHDVWLGRLGLTVERPTATLAFRGNRVESAGLVGDCTGALKPGDVEVTFVTEGVDADTGRRISRVNSALPLTAGLAFETADAARLVAMNNVLTARARTRGDSAEVGPLGADSVFYRVAHEILAGSLPRLGIQGLPDSGQGEVLEVWKADYPEVASEVALRRTDAVERLDVINDIGIIAQVVAEAHYPEVAEGVEGVMSVWDIAYLYSMGVSKKLLMGNRVLGLFGTKAMRMGAVTSASTEMLVNSALPGIGKRLGMASALEQQALNRFLGEYEDDLVNQVLLKAQWQLGSGKMLKLALRNLNSPTQLQDDPNYYVQGVYPVELPVDATVHGAMETALRLLVEPFIQGSVALGQERCLGLSFGGSQDLALATGENVKDVLQTASGIALRWGDLHAAVHDVSVAARDSLMWIEMLPIPAVQGAAGKAFYVADAVGRVGAGLKVADHGEFLKQLAGITARGVESVVEGNLDAFGYPIEKPAGGSPAAGDPDPGLPRQPAAAGDVGTATWPVRDRITASVRAGDTNAVADLAATAAAIYATATELENLLATRAEALLDPEPWTFADPAAVTARARAYRWTVSQAALERMALMQGMLAWYLGPDPTLRSNLLATAERIDDVESTLAAAAPAIRADLTRITLPDRPVVVRIQSPLAVETGTTNLLTVVIANLGEAASVGGRLTLVTPTEPWGELLSPATQAFRTSDGRAQVEWAFVPTRAGTHTEDLVVRLVSEDDRLLDVHPIALSVEEAGGTGAIEPAAGGTVSTALGTASLVLAPGAFPAGTASGIGSAPALHARSVVDVHLLPVTSVARSTGFVPAGDQAFQVLAVDAQGRIPSAFVEGRAVVTLRWDESSRPPDTSAGALRVFLAEEPGRWIPLESVVDVGSRTVRAALPRPGWLAAGWPDAEPPAAPSGLAAEAGETGIRLRWNPSVSPDVEGYLVIARDESGGRIEAVYRVTGADQEGLNVRDHPRGLRRRYAVLTCDRAGNRSAESVFVTATWPGGGETGAPVLSALLDGDHVVLSWAVSSSGYRLETTARLPADSWSPVAVAPVTVQDRQVVTLPRGSGPEFYRLARP